MFKKKLLFILIMIITAVSAVSANDLNKTADATTIDEIEDTLEITKESSLTTTKITVK